MFQSVFLILLGFKLTIGEVSIKQLYFDPTTSMTSGRQDGVIIIETSNGKRSTICNTDFTNNDASVLCRMLGYSNGLNAFAIISSKNSYKHSKVYFSNFSCNGDENSVQSCSNYQYQLSNSECQAHNNDVHVFCNSPRNFSKYTFANDNLGCDPRFAELQFGTPRSGLMVVKDDNNNLTFCGINNNFGQQEAQLFCKLLCFKDSKYARIISNYDIKGASIGGFRNMKCPAGASTLNQCWNVDPNDKEHCTPADNIGVACDNEPPFPEPKPNIICHKDFMTLEWKNSLFPEINPDHVNIVSESLNCSNVKKESINGDIRLTVKLENCLPDLQGTENLIHFQYNIQRVFPMKNNLVVKNSQLFVATCSIKRKESAGIKPIKLQMKNLSPSGNAMTLPTTLELSTNYDFSVKLKSPYSVKIGTIIYGRITLLNAPVQIKLVLEKCNIYNANYRSEVLIEKKCAIRSDVKINPINDTSIIFSYHSFALDRENEPLSIYCETNKCGKLEIACSSSCQKP